MSILAPEVGETATPHPRGPFIFPGDDKMCVPCQVTWNSLGIGSSDCWMCGKPGRSGSKSVLLAIAMEPCWV